MARIEIDLPETFLFSTELAIRIGDVNYGGHLGNDAVLSLAHEARLRFLNAHGFTSELDVAGVGLAMADAAVVYRSEGKHGMVLRVEVAAADVKSRSFDLVFRMTDTRSGAEVARVKTGMIWFDYRARRLVKMPEEFKSALEAPAAKAPVP